jgi:hypothetical protein
MALFVINEWLWADLSGNNDIQHQREALVVIERLPSSSHQIVIIEGSAFDQKAWSLCKNTSPVLVQRIGGIYVARIRQNSDRCLILKPEQVIALPDELAKAIKADDHYLIQAQLTVKDSILVTTDNPLREVLDKAGLSSLSREEFLRDYF